MAGAVAPRPNPGIDLGRVFAVVIFAALTAINAFGAWEDAVEGRLTISEGLVSALTLAFYVLLTVAYLRRERTASTDRDWRAWLVAFLGTGSGFVIPFVATEPRQPGVLAISAAVVLIGGLAFMVWALVYLGSNISVVPQARAVVTTGPYAYVRHPLYAAEIVNVVGICLSFKGFSPWGVLFALVLLQLLRARREEQLLERELLGYAAYRARTPMLLPMTLPTVRR